jgi:hypothetical protein
MIQVSKPRRMRWVGHMTYMGDRRGAYRVGGDLRRRDHLEDLYIHGSVILKRIFKWNGGIDRIDLVLDRNRWETLLNAVMNLLVT